MAITVLVTTAMALVTEWVMDILTALESTLMDTTITYIIVQATMALMEMALWEQI